MRVIHRPLTIAALAVISTWIWMALTVHYNYGGNWTALFCIGERNAPPPHLRESENLYIFRNSTGYDGQFYHDLAHDPALIHGTEKYIDAPQLRQRRILLPALAWLLALGRDRWVDTAYFGIILLCAGAGVYWLACYAVELGRSAWWGLFYLAVPSTLISIDRMTTDLMLTTLFMAFAFYLRSGSLWRLWIIAAAACLTRETGLCIVAGYGFYLLLRRDYPRYMIFITSAIPFLAWAVYVTRHTPRGGQGHYPFHYPFSAIIEAVLHPAAYPFGPAAQTAITIFDYTVLAAFLGATVLACRIAWRDQALASITIPFVALVLLLGSLFSMADEYVGVYAYGRPFSPILLAVVLDSLTRRARLGLALAGIVSLRTATVLGLQAIAIVRKIAS